jgi:tetratricopeptide (TPR) repeat protein
MAFNYFTLMALIAAAPMTSAMSQGETVYARVADSVLTLRIVDDAGADVGTATGFIIAQDSLLTNAHVARAGHILVQVGPIDLPCEIKKIDHTNDLALCSFQAVAKVRHLEFASDDPKPGSTVFAIGTPRGLDKTISQGLFTGYRTIEGQRVAQISAAISPGSSGGPVLNDAAEVVGVAVSSYANGQNLNFAVPLDIARAFVLDDSPSGNADALVSVLQDISRTRTNTPFSAEANSPWQTLDRKFVNTFRDAMDATTDGALLQTLFKTAEADFFHPELMASAAQKALAMSKKPDRLLYANLALALYWQSQFRKAPTLHDAETAAEKAVELGASKNPDDWLLLGDIQRETGDNPKAYGSYRRAEALVKSGTAQAGNAYVHLFEVSRDLARTSEAELWFNKAKTEPSTNAYDWAEYAAFLSDNHRDRESALAYLEADRLAPSSYEYVCRAGVEFFAAGVIDSALSAERQCIEVATSKPKSDDTVALAHRVMALMLDDRGVYDEAIGHAKQAIRLDPSDPWAHYASAVGLNALRRFDEAVVESKAALRLSDGKYAEMHFQLGSAYFELGQWPEAQQAFQKSAEMDAKDSTAAFNVAASFYNERYYSDALIWYREALRRDPNTSNREEILRKINVLSTR